MMGYENNPYRDQEDGQDRSTSKAKPRKRSIVKKSSSDKDDEDVLLAAIVRDEDSDVMEKKRKKNKDADLFNRKKKKKKDEKSGAEIGFFVEKVIAELEVVAEEDAELNRQGKPAINKLKKLSFLTNVLSKKQLQIEFLDHGVTTLLKNWLEPLPDGSLPNINIRAAVLNILNDFPIDLSRDDRREQLKQSGLGKVVMFLSKSDEETKENRRIARELVDKWSRSIFNNSARFQDDMNKNNLDDQQRISRLPVIMSNKKAAAARDNNIDDDDLDQFISVNSNKIKSSSSMVTRRPEPMSMDFVVRPQSKVVLDHNHQVWTQANRMSIIRKKMNQMKASNRKKQLQATKLSVQGRGMVIYI